MHATGKVENCCSWNYSKQTVKCRDNIPKSPKTLTEVLNRKILRTSENARHTDVSQTDVELFKQQKIDETLSSKDDKLLHDFLMREFLLNPTTKAGRQDWLKLMVMKHSEYRSTFEKYIAEQNNCFTVIKQDPKIAKQTLLQLGSGDESEFLDEEPYHSVAQNFTELLDQMEYNKSLFSFIVGILPTGAAKDEVLLEIADMLVQHSFNTETGAVLPFHVLSSYMDDLLKEAKCLTDTSLVT